MMKKIIFVVALALAIVSCKNNTTPETITVDTQVETVKKEVNTEDIAANYNKAEFKIDGMTCAVGCAATIQKNLNKMEGVASAKVDFDKKLAMVSYDETKVNLEDLETTVTKTADVYKVSDMKKVDAFSETK